MDTLLRGVGLALLACSLGAAAQPLAVDTPSTTRAGNRFIVPQGWTVASKGELTLVEAPEAGSRIVLMDTAAPSAEDAIAQAWAAYKPDRTWPLIGSENFADRDGWTRIRTRYYRTSPDEKRVVWANARFANGLWTVVLFDADNAVREKRAAQIVLVTGQLLPKGYERESFAGRKAHRLDARRLAELHKFVETSQKALGVPGVSVGLVQDGKVIFAGGFGVRELGKAAAVDADTRYMIASNTKAMTTLMLAKLVEEGRLAWDTPAAQALPTFRLGSADTTARVLVRHLICACTGMPRRDLEWQFEFKGASADSVMATLATMQPTSAFGALYQYSNPLAAAAGYVGGRVAFPKLELGSAYDEAMRTRVFAPLGMSSTTFDFARAQEGNFALPHAIDLDGRTSAALHALNHSVIPIRPAGGAWSSVRDVLKYVQMELADGRLPDGARYIDRDLLLARRSPQVNLDQDFTYGMGLVVGTRRGVTVVSHGGGIFGYYSDMMWLPDHGVGAVVLTNGSPGWLIRSIYRRKLLEVLFDGQPEADAEIAASGKRYFGWLAAQRRDLAVPANPAAARELAARYVNPALGEIAVKRADGRTVFDFGEWASEMGSHVNPDGSVSFVAITPGVIGFNFMVRGGERRALVLRDAQHEYVFQEIQH
jgi:CubicO group peptidase (beta-lactamase class C family)